MLDFKVLEDGVNVSPMLTKAMICTKNSINTDLASDNMLMWVM